MRTMELQSFMNRRYKNKTPAPLFITIRVTPRGEELASIFVNSFLEQDFTSIGYHIIPPGAIYEIQTGLPIESITIDTIEQSIFCSKDVFQHIKK